VLPPDPSTIAPKPAAGVVTNLFESTQFLYTGDNPTQTGVVSGTITLQRAAELRGKVLARGGAPLPAVRITILSHPEFGQTLSRADGMFDLVVNGGGLLTVNYELVGYLTVQRQLSAPWQRYTAVPDVVLTALDPNVAAIDTNSTSPIQVARGSVSSDSNGARQATLLFPQGETATLTLANGTTQPLSGTFHVRATEYTVGDEGPAAMPGVLPSNSEYTYAAEFSLDEAISAGATTVNFGLPVIDYTENFLNYPVGQPVPVGFYDRVQGVWVPEPSGLIVRILSTAGGVATLDVDGSGQPADGGRLASLGITDSELQQLATLYSTGTSLWRVPLMHFSPIDCNWGYGLPDDAVAPPTTTPAADLDKSCKTNGSIIGCEDQTLGEDVPIVGAPFKLHYASDRVPGRKDINTVPITISGPHIPMSLEFITADVTVAGVKTSTFFPPDINQTWPFLWNHLDLNNNTVYGPQPAWVCVHYWYPAVPQGTGSFGGGGNGTGAMAIEGPQLIPITRCFELAVGGWDAVGDGLGGWSIDVHHVYDPLHGTLFYGNGERRSTQSVPSIVNSIAGGGTSTADNVPATTAKVVEPAALAVMPDGSYDFSEYVLPHTARTQIRHVDPSGTITTLVNKAGLTCNLNTSCGDGGQAVNAQLSLVLGMTRHQNGSLYVADLQASRVRRVGTDGIITTVAGVVGHAGYNGDNIPANQAWLSAPWGVAASPDGNIYIADSGNNRIRRIGLDGLITTVVGNGTCGGLFVDFSNPTSATICRPEGIAVGPDGTVYFADPGHGQVLHLLSSGTLELVAGAKSPCVAPCINDGTAAEFATFGPVIPALAVAADGSVYIVDANVAQLVSGVSGCNCVYRVGTNDIINRVTGQTHFPNEDLSLAGDGGPAIDGVVNQPVGVALSPDGTVYVSDTENNRVRQVKSPFPGVSANSIVIPAEDGSEVYQFDGLGRQLKTLDPLTGATIYSFGYDSAGKLSSITDASGNVTQIQHDTANDPTAIIAPYGQQTTLAVDANGYLASITNPALEKITLVSDDLGLLKSYITPRQALHAFTYEDATGRLTSDVNPVQGAHYLARTDNATGYKVAVTNALGDTTTYSITNAANGDQTRVITSPDNEKVTIQTKADKSQTTTDPTGVVTAVTYGPDPRWGMLAPIVASSTTGSASRPGFLTTTMTRATTLSDPLNLFSIVNQSDTTTINGFAQSSVYDGGARTVTTTDPGGEVTITSLDLLGRPTTQQTSNLAEVQYGYDNHGRLASISEGTGVDQRTTKVTYNAQGFPATVTDPLGDATSFTYDPAGRVLTEQLPTGQVLTSTYDPDGNLASHTDPQGIFSTYEYDFGDRKSAMTLDPNGQAVRTEYGYDVADNLVSKIEDTGTGHLNVKTLYTPTPVGNSYAVSKLIDPLGKSTSYTYTSFGKVQTVTDPLNHTTVYGYTDEGWPNSVTPPFGPGSSTTYDGQGRVATVTDPRGITTGYGYDSVGRLQTVTRGTTSVDGYPALNEATIYGYDSNSRITQVTDPRQMMTTRTYDPFGQIKTITDPNGHLTTFAYDALNRLILKTVGADVPAQQQQTAYTYDGSGRPVTVQVDPNGLDLTTTYLYTGRTGSDTWNLQQIIDPRGNSTLYHYNFQGLRDQTTDALFHTWTFGYDNLGRAINQTEPIQRTTSFAVDALGRRTGLTANGQTETWNYNPDGTLDTYTDFSSQVTTYTYDSDARLTGIIYPAGTAPVAYTYDDDGNVRTMTDGLGTTTYTFDAVNRLNDRSRGGRTISYGYNANDEVTSISYWQHGTVLFGYDNAGEVSSLTPWNAGPTSYTYQSNGALASQTRGNGATTSYTYDTAVRLTGLLHQTGGATPATLQNIRYVLDANGNRTQLTDNDGVTAFGYDALNRLSSAGYPSIPSGPAAENPTYTYDAAGNRLGDGTSTYGYDDSDRITNPGYSYDTNGNLLSDGTTTYSYDGANRLIQTVKGGVTTTYGYDGWGNLIQETVNGVTSDLLLDESSALPRVLGEERSDGTSLLYAYGPEGFAAQQQLTNGISQPVFYPLLDGLRSARQLTDATGAIVRSTTFDAFGVVRYQTGTALSTLGYTGERTGTADGTVYLRARHYQPNLGRFLQRDTFPGLPYNPQSLNRYTYVQNNPETLTDPGGHFWQNDIGDGLLAAASYLAQVFSNYQSSCSGLDAFVGLGATGHFSSFDPMADSPIAKFLLYGSNTPILDFLTNDRNLQIAQNAATVVAFAAGVIGTGSLGLEAVTSILEMAASSISSITGTTIATAAAGIVSTHPELPDEATEEVEGGAAALGPQLNSALQSIENPAFWNGPGALQAAQQAGVTLDKTPLGQAAAAASNEMKANGINYEVIRETVWEPASRAFAEAASGTPTAFINSANPSSVWSQVEFSTLMNNPAVDQISIKYMPDAVSPFLENDEQWFEMGESWAQTGQFYPPAP
jgi:RHS repeat-associated protein